MKKLSVIAMVAMTAFASTSCTNFDENEPKAVEGYGYISLSASSDNSVVTRTEQTVEDVDSWYAWVKDNAGTYAYGSEETGKLIGEGLKTQAFKAGEYGVVVSNYATETAWAEANDGFGAAYYISESTSVTVTSGTTQTVNVACGKAKNAMFKVVNTADNVTKLDVKVSAPRELTFSLEEGTLDKESFFKAEETLKYTIEYTIGDKTGTISDKELTLGAAATKSTLTIKSTDTGLITVEITYDDEFDEGNSGEIVIDPATGTEKQD